MPPHIVLKICKNDRSVGHLHVHTDTDEMAEVTTARVVGDLWSSVFTAPRDAKGLYKALRAGDKALTKAVQVGIST